jgi:hypothetical protein
LETLLKNEDVTEKGQRLTAWLPQSTIRWIDKTRGYYSKSQFVEIAIDRLREEMERNNSENKK